MNDNPSMLIDIIIILVLGVFVLSRFFGAQLPKDNDLKKKQRPPMRPGEQPIPQPAQGQRRPLPVAPPRRKGPTPAELEKLEGLEKIVAVDPSFNTKAFLSGAKEAYTLYWQAMAERDEKTLENLLSPRLLDEALDRLDELKEHKQRLVTRIDGFTDLHVLSTRVMGRTAIVELKYTVQQAQAALKETQKDTKAQAKTVTSVWTWARNVDADDPNWELEAIQMMS